jgi:hypothetical protein
MCAFAKSSGQESRPRLHRRSTGTNSSETKKEERRVDPLRPHPSVRMGQAAVQTEGRHASGRASPPGGPSHRARSPCVGFRCTDAVTARLHAASAAAFVAGHGGRKRRTRRLPVVRLPGKQAVLPVRRTRDAAHHGSRAGAAVASTDCVRGEETPSKAGVDRQVRLILSKTSPAHESIRSLRDVSPLEKESLGTDERRINCVGMIAPVASRARTVLHEADRARLALRRGSMRRRHAVGVSVACARVAVPCCDVTAALPTYGSSRQLSNGVTSA